MNRVKPWMAKTKARRIEKVIVKINGIIIVPRINMKTLHRIGRDCKKVICRRPSIRVETSCNQRTLRH